MDLLDGENLIWRGRPSWRAMLVFYVKWGALALVPAVGVGLLDWLADAGISFPIALLATVVLLAIVLLIGWMLRLGTSYTITDRRIVIRRGILSRHERSTHIDRVQNVDLSQSMLQRMLKVGTLDFDTAGTDESEADFRFVGIEDPRELRQRIDDAYRRAGLSGGGDGPAPAAPASA